VSLHREMSFLKQSRGSQDSEEGGTRPWTSFRADAGKAAGALVGILSLSTQSPENLGSWVGRLRVPSQSGIGQWECLEGSATVSTTQGSVQV
jgi:hypothetical protein